MRFVAIAGAALATAALFSSCDPGPKRQPTDGRGERDAADDGRFGRVFTDVSEASGIRFRHENGGTGKKLLPETLGSGVAVLDYDGDGRPDLFFVQCRGLDRDPSAAGRCALYRNLGDGTFADVSAAVGADIAIAGMGATVADFDGDDDDDVYVTGVDRNALLENRNGRFVDVATELGVGGARWRDRKGVEHPAWATAAVFFDADADGDLDLFVAHYVEWTVDSDIYTTIDGVRKAFTTPDRYRGLPCRLYRREANGRYVDVSEAVGLLKHEGKALGVALWDFNADGRLDVFVANDTRPNFLFVSTPDGGYREEAALRQAAYDENGRARAGMGVDIAALGEPPAPTVAIGNFSGEALSLFRWSADGVFESIAAASGLVQATLPMLTFGVVFEDFDYDGRLDLVLANGHIEPEVQAFFPSERFAQPALLFRGAPHGRFVAVDREAGPALATPRVGRGLATFDLEGDGDLDLVLTSNGGPPTLLRNDLGDGAANHFLRVRLRGQPPNTRAVGAVITVRSEGRVRSRCVRTGSSYLSQSDWVMSFGLGHSSTVEALTVRWPDGRTTTHPVAAVDGAPLVCTQGP